MADDIKSFDESGVNAKAMPPDEGGDSARCLDTIEEKVFMRLGVKSPISWSVDQE